MSAEGLIPFNRPHMVGKELWYIAQAHQAGQLAGDGPFTKKCHAWLEQRTSSRKALLTHSCTGALDMAAMLAGVGPGDEVIMPSFTFVSTANAFVLRGATRMTLTACAAWQSFAATRAMQASSMFCWRL